MGSPPNVSQWGDDAHLPAWLIADAADNPNDALDEDAAAHLKTCLACETLLYQAQANADDAGWIPEIDNAELPDLGRLANELASNVVGRQTPAITVGQVWQLAGPHSTELAVVTKVEPSGSFVAPVTADPAELTDPYTVQASLEPSSIVMAVWFSLETFIHSEVFARSIGNIDTALTTAGRAAWRHGEPLAGGSHVTGPGTAHNAEVIAYREQLQQRITSLAHVQIVPEIDEDDETPDAGTLLRELGVSTTRVREILNVNASVAAAIIMGDRSVNYDEARTLSDALGADIPATVVLADPELVSVVAAPRTRSLFIELATRKGTDEWTERRRALDSQLGLAARTTASDNESKWADLLNQYLIKEFDAAKVAEQER